MPLATIVFGLLLCALGGVSYTGAVEYFGQNPYAATALIPALVGAVLVVCGLLALDERRLKHAMHAAAVIGLLGFFGALARAVPMLPTVLDGGTEALKHPAAFRCQVAMAVLCGVFVALCVNSFVQVRRRRRDTPSPPAAAGGN